RGFRYLAAPAPRGARLRGDPYPCGMRFFCDRALGRKVPNALKLRGIDAVAHDDHFHHKTDDDIWLPEVGQRGWTVLTKDNRMRFRQAEKHALVSYKIGSFAIRQGNATWEQMVAILVSAWDKIETISASELRPFLYTVY